jgi:hypothetical protein
MGKQNVIPTRQFMEAQCIWGKVQYLHDNLWKHNVYGAKCNTHIMTLIHTIYERGKCNTCMKI